MEIDYGHHRQNMPHDSDLIDDVDDTDFYAELTRQILLLTADEDEEDHLVVVPPPKNAYSHGRRTGGTTQGKSIDGFDFNYSVFAGSDYFRWSEREISGNHHNDRSAPAAVPNWLESLWGSSGGSGGGAGTGVFIPRASRRRHRPRRKNNGRQSNKLCSGRVEQ